MYVFRTSFLKVQALGHVNTRQWNSVFSASLHYMFQSYQGQIQKDTPEKFFSRYDDVKDYEDKFWKIEVSPASADNAEAKIVFIQKKNTFSDNIKGIAYVVTKKDSLDDELPDYTARRLTK